MYAFCLWLQKNLVNIYLISFDNRYILYAPSKCVFKTFTLQYIYDKYNMNKSIVNLYPPKKWWKISRKLNKHTLKGQGILVIVVLRRKNEYHLDNSETHIHSTN